MFNRRYRPVRVAATAVLLTASACGSTAISAPTEPAVAVATETPTVKATVTTESDPPEETTANPDELFPDVLQAEATPQDDGSWTIAATLSSPYDSPERYADAFRALTPDGEELGVRVLTHDHASEQPFTRSLTDVAIPDDVTTITIEGRDQQSGWGGATVEVTLQR